MGVQMRKKLFLLVLFLGLAVLLAMVLNNSQISGDSSRIDAVNTPSPVNDSNSTNEPGTETVKVLIVYYTVQNHTEKLAQAVAEGAGSVPGVQVILKSVEQASADDALKAHAIILGSPVHNANVAPEMQKYINSWSFGGPSFSEKIGAAFTTGGGISAGEELVQTNILHSMLIYNMIVVGGPNWQQPFGASAITNEHPFLDSKSTESGYVEPQFLDKGKLLGMRVAELSVRFNKSQNQTPANKKKSDSFPAHQSSR